MRYAWIITIDDKFYKANDEPAQEFIDDAFLYETQKEADDDSKIVRGTWDVMPDAVKVSKVEVTVIFSPE